MRFSIVAAAACLLLPLTCFAAGERYLDFSPQVGEARQYQTYFHGSAQVDGTEQFLGEARMLMRYRVLDDTPHLRLHLQPTYAHVMEGVRVGLSSVKTAGQDGALRDLMDGGFIVTMDAGTGEVRDFEVGDGEVWQRLTSRNSDAGALLDELRGVLVRPSQWPGVARVPLREGAELTVEGSGELPQLGMRVERVTAGHIRLSIDADAGNVRMTGFVVLDRDGGWVDRMAVVLETSLEEAGEQAVVRHRVAMVSDDWQGTLPFANTLGLGDTEFRPMGTPPVDGKALSAQPGRDEVFASAVGEFGFGRGGTGARLASEVGLVTLQLGHRVREEMAFGRLELSDIELRDGDGAAIDLPVHADRLTHIRWWDQAYVGSSGLLLPLGWSVEEALAGIAEVRAVASYHPSTVGEVEVPLDRARTVRVEDGDGWVTVTPLPHDEGAFEFRFGSSVHSGIAWNFPPGLGAYGRLVADVDAAAGWLDPQEVLFLNRVRADGWGSKLQVQFEQVPERLVFHSYRIAASPTMRQTVRFVDAEQRYADPALPPMEQQWLYPPDDFPELDDGGIAEMHELEPELAYNRLTLALSHAQAVSCTLSVDGTAGEQGPPLRWRPVVDGEAGLWFLRQHQLPRLHRWELQTEDGAHNRFHDLEVRTRLQCPGQVRWRAADYPLDERPWLVDLHALLGEDPDPGMRVRELLARYRFLDETGHALALQPPASVQDILSPVDAVLGDYLFEDRYLRIAGIPKRIESLQVTDEPIERRWTTRFGPQ